MENFYITTAINYTNGNPHIGHAYEIIIADFIARHYRLTKDVYFLTGSDEHGQKIADTAAIQNITPIELCDQYVNAFQNLNNQLNISNDYYIRTTSEKHKLCVHEIWKTCAENDDIYYGKYEGWYNKREERFVSESEAEAMNYTDGAYPLIKTTEPSYFFRLSKYQSRLIDYIEQHQEFIFPSDKRHLILERLKEPLTDLSISRTSFDWGIPIPANFKGNIFKGNTNDQDKHVVYVWFDALLNYISGNKNNASADIHLIVKILFGFMQSFGQLFYLVLIYLCLKLLFVMGSSIVMMVEKCLNLTVM